MTTVDQCALSAFETETGSNAGEIASDITAKTPEELWMAIGAALGRRSGLLFDLPEPRERMRLAFANGGEGDVICANCRRDHVTGWRLVIQRGRTHHVCRECIAAYALPLGAILMERAA